MPLTKLATTSRPTVGKSESGRGSLAHISSITKLLVSIQALDVAKLQFMLNLKLSILTTRLALHRVIGVMESIITYGCH